MKRKRRSSAGAHEREMVKTSVSLPENLLEFAEEECAREGHTSVSSYLAFLLRMEKRQHERRHPPALPGKYPEHAQEMMLTEEKATPYGGKGTGRKVVDEGVKKIVSGKIPPPEGNP